MKLKLFDALQINMAILAISNAGKFASPVFGFAIASNHQALKPHMEAFEETRRKTAEHFAKKDKDDKPVLTEDGRSLEIEDMAAFTKAIMELQDAEIEVELRMIPLDKFPDQIDPGHMLGLMPMIEAEQKEAA